MASEIKYLLKCGKKCTCTQHEQTSTEGDWTALNSDKMPIEIENHLIVWPCWTEGWISQSELHLRKQGNGQNRHSLSTYWRFNQYIMKAWRLLAYRMPLLQSQNFFWIYMEHSIPIMDCLCNLKVQRHIKANYDIRRNIKTLLI